MVMLLVNIMTFETILVYLKQKSGKKAILKARNEARKYIILNCIYMGVISEKNLYILSYKITFSTMYDHTLIEQLKYGRPKQRLPLFSYLLP